jgi:hypothetical protein
MFKSRIRTIAAALVLALAVAALAWGQSARVSSKGWWYNCQPHGLQADFIFQTQNTTAGHKIISVLDSAGNEVSSVSSAGSAGQIVAADGGSVQTIPNGTTTLTVAPGISLIRVVGTGATTLGGTPIITAGTAIGQMIILMGTSDTNTVTVPDSGNCNLSAAAVLGNQDTLTLIWDGTKWVQTSVAAN